MDNEDNIRRYMERRRLERETRPESNDSAWRDRIIKQAWDEQVQEEIAEADAEAHIPPTADAQIFELRRLFRL